MYSFSNQRPVIFPSCLILMLWLGLIWRFKYIKLLLDLSSILREASFVFNSKILVIKIIFPLFPVEFRNCFGLITTLSTGVLTANGVPLRSKIDPRFESIFSVLICRASACWFKKSLFGYIFWKDIKPRTIVAPKINNKTIKKRFLNKWLLVFLLGAVI